jgi:hypothetical protein
MSYKEENARRTVRSGKPLWLSDLLDASYLIPGLKSVLHNGTVLPSTQTMSSRLEMSSDGTKGESRKRCACAG